MIFRAPRHSAAASLIDDSWTALRAFRRAHRRRAASAQLSAALAARPPLPRDTFEAAVYFADPPVNLYQMRQWYEPMRRLAQERPVVVIARSPSAVRAMLDECPLPVFYGATIGDIETFVGEQPLKVAFYVNHHQRNFQLLRFSRMFHVFVNHGESDKTYMASNQLKAYDYCFVAGDAAVDRIRGALLQFDVDGRLIRIGRPQVDVEWPGPGMPADGRTVVLYAPTWEGDRPSMSYGSTTSHGTDLVRGLVDDGGYRVIYRPHPRTGVFDPSVGAASRRIAAMLTAANEQDPAVGHVVDTESPFGWHLRAADVCVCDVSAVAYDWLATGKPLMLTRPTAPDARVDLSGIAGSVPLLAAADAAGAAPVIGALVREGADERYRELVRSHFGETAPGAGMKRFLEGCRSVMAAHDRAVAARPPSVIDLRAVEAASAGAPSDGPGEALGARSGATAAVQPDQSVIDEMEQIGGA